MTFREVRTECGGEKWTPVLVVRHDDKTFIPCFPTQEMTRRFVQRNTENHRQWLYGAIDLSEENVRLLEGRGFPVVPFDYPRRLTGAVFDIEIMEFETDREIDVEGKRV